MREKICPKKCPRVTQFPQQCLAGITNSSQLSTSCFLWVHAFSLPLCLFTLTFLSSDKLSLVLLLNRNTIVPSSANNSYCFSWRAQKHTLAHFDPFSCISTTWYSSTPLEFCSLWIFSTCFTMQVTSTDTHRILADHRCDTTSPSLFQQELHSGLEKLQPLFTGKL